MPALIPTNGEFDPRGPEHFEAYRQDVLSIARHLAGIPERENRARDSVALDQEAASTSAIPGESNTP